MDDTLNAINEAQDVEDDYQYDLNGNMISDQNKHITSVTYNHLNLPKKVTFEGSNKSIEYLYDATGVKLKKSVMQTNPQTNGVENAITEYLGGFQYTSNTINNLSGETINVIQLQYIFTPEGYVNNTVIANKNNYNYVYNYTDHLGNIRLSYAQDQETQQLTVLQTHQYYPFGLEHVNWVDKREFDPILIEVLKTDGTKTMETKVRLVQVANSGYQYQYNGKEWQDELGLNWYDYGARNYDASLGRFMNHDPKSEQYVFQSPYVYANDSPILFMDINGEGVDNDYGIDKNGNIKLIQKTDDKFDRLYVAKSDENGNAVLDDKGNASKIIEGEGTENKDYVQVNKENVDSSSMISELTVDGKKGENDRDVNFTTTQNKQDAFKVFQFAAENSNSEWSLQANFIDNKTIYTIGTYHMDNRAPNFNNPKFNLGFSYKNMFYDMHSHIRTNGPSQGPDSDMTQPLTKIQTRYIYSCVPGFKGTLWRYGGTYKSPIQSPSKFKIGILHTFPGFKP